MSENYQQVFDTSPDKGQDIFTGEGSFEKNCAYCEMLKGKSNDIIIRKFTLANGMRCAVVLVDGMCNKQLVEQDVVLAARRLSLSSGSNKFCAQDGLIQHFGVVEISAVKSLSDGYRSALTGDAFVVIENEPQAYVFGYRAVNTRSINDSSTGGSVRGPHEAFTENIRTNTALLRKRIADPNFVIEHLKVGQRSNTVVGLCYILGVTRPELIADVKKRIESVCIDIINDSGELEQLLEDDPSALFPQTDGSELSDVVAKELCNGRIALIVNGSPYVLMLPATLSRLMHVSEDDYQRWSVASFAKILRWAASIISVIAPSLYVAMVSFHPGMLPTDLLIITAINRLNVPFSAFTEVLILELSLEILREASIRMPKSIGTALSIVGGIIIGDAAISAGLISPLLIIVVGISTMASFVVPSYPLASSYRLIKYMLLVFSALMGLTGLVCGVVVWLSILVSVRSFGVDFTAPFSPFNRREAMDGIIEPPMKYRTRRPAYLDPVDRIRYRPNGQK